MIAFPKHKTERNPGLIDRMKREIGHDEYNPGARGPLEGHHIEARGMGGCKGPDMRENIIILTGPVKYGAGNHGAAHRGEIPKASMYCIVAAREGITPEECRRRVRRAMGYDV